jgi:serine/threonine protein kinase
MRAMEGFNMQVLLNQPHTQAMDIFSLGVILFVVLTGRKPMSKGDATHLRYAHTNAWSYEGIRSPAYKGLSLSSKDLLLWMLDRDPTQRPTAEQVLQHAWLQTPTPTAALQQYLGSHVREGMHAELCARVRLQCAPSTPSALSN